MAAKKTAKKAAKETTKKPAGKTASPKSRAAKAAGDAAPKKHRIYGMAFSVVYPLYVQKAEKKGRTKKEVDEVIRWLTGYTPQGLKKQIKLEKDFETFFAEAPELNPNADKITGTVCGVRIEEVDDPLMRKIRYLDKLVDELAKGKPMEKVLRK